MVTYACRYSSGHITGKCPLEYLQAPLFSYFFIYMIPIDSNFFLYLFVSFTIIISWRAPSNLISGKPVSQYALYSLIFSPLRSVINWEQHEKYPYNQFSHTRKYTEWSIVKARASFIVFKVGVSLGHGFVSLLVVLDSVPRKE